MRAMCDLLSEGRAPAELVQVYAAEDARERGRNDPCTCDSGSKWKRCQGRDRRASVAEPRLVEMARTTRRLSGRQVVGLSSLRASVRTASSLPAFRIRAACVRRRILR